MKFWERSSYRCLIFTSSVALLIPIAPLHADRILVIGDSWAWPVAPELQITLHENGHTNMFVEAAPFIGQSWQLSTPDGLRDIEYWIEQRPDVNFVQISIGGNDWLNSSWTPAWASTTAEHELVAGIIQNVEIMADHVLSLRPDLQILWSSYDFPRPVNNGSPLEINTFLITFAERLSQFAMSKPGVSFVDVNGSLQAAFGFDGQQYSAADPAYVIPPGDPSLPNPGFPSPLQPFMRNDSWHLKSEGYKALAQAQFDGFYSSLLAGENFHINPGLNDAWYDPDTNGQGFLITVFPDIQRVFVAWFTFDTERPPEDVTAMVGEPGQRWLTAEGPYDGDAADLTIFLTEGGVFDSGMPAASTDPAGDGSLKIEFADCTDGLVSYSVTSLGISGEIPIQRISAANVPLCELLDAQLK